MIKSMTGFGESKRDDEQCFILVQLKSLNSKHIDINPRIPKAFFAKEIEIKNLISEKMQRGKITLNIEFIKKNFEAPSLSFNIDLFKWYYHTMEQMASEVNAPKKDIFQIVSQIPDVMSMREEQISKDDWNAVKECLEDAINQCDNFRKQEGNQLKGNLIEYVNNIRSLLEKVESEEQERLTSVRQKLEKRLEELLAPEQVDQNRFEQELIYYLEKIDVQEEKDRLRSHIQYFNKLIGKPAMGKKLIFLSQEMGREINTLGSKANHATIQRYVVEMKDELEKIKEQLQNIL